MVGLMNSYPKRRFNWEGTIKKYQMIYDYWRSTTLIMTLVISLDISLDE